MKPLLKPTPERNQERAQGAKGDKIEKRAKLLKDKDLEEKKGEKKVSS